jgi:hypothetical protein
MRTVLLDKNAGSKKFRDACNREGVVRCILLPRSIRDSNDESVLEFAISNGYLTLTFDRPLFIQSAPVLSGRNPGLIVLRADDGAIHRISTKTAPKLLRDFKADFPDWYVVPWKNSIVELTPTLALVYQTRTVTPVLVALLKREDDGWQSGLKRLLAENAL